MLFKLRPALLAVVHIKGADKVHVAKKVARKCHKHQRSFQQHQNDVISGASNVQKASLSILKYAMPSIYRHRKRQIHKCAIESRCTFCFFHVLFVPTLSWIVIKLCIILTHTYVFIYTHLFGSSENIVYLLVKKTSLIFHFIFSLFYHKHDVGYGLTVSP